MLRRRALRVSAVCALVLTVLIGSAIAQSADRPTVKNGDQWRFAVYYEIPSAEPSRVWVIRAISPTRIEATENGEPLIFTPDLNVLDSPRHAESNPQGLRFPLEVGQRWRYTSDWLFKSKGSKGSVTIDVVVMSHEKVRARLPRWPS
jgi:hypothetical protein